jgi:hypothetical protein
VAELEARLLEFAERAAACMKAIVRAELRMSSDRADSANALVASAFTERVVARFRDITGITPSLPGV